MSYHSGFLYMSDGYGNPTEVINEARTAANLARAASTGVTGRFGLVADNANCAALAYQPCNDWSPDWVKNQVTALRDATLWMDPSFSTPNEVGLQNWGTGGEVMNASYPTPGTSPLLLQHTGDSYLYLPGVGNNYASSALIGDYQITGDLEIVVRVALTDYTPTANQILCARRTAGQYSWQFYIGSTGQLSVNITSDGSTAIQSLSAIPSAGTFADNVVYWFKMTRTASTGVCTWQYAADQRNEPTSWTTIAASVNGASGNIFAGTAPMDVGGGLGGGFEGKFFRCIVRNGIGGPTVFDCDFGQLVTGSETSITERSRHQRSVSIFRATSGRKSVAVVRSGLIFGTDDYLEIPDHTLLDGAANSFTVMIAVRQWTTPVNFGRYIDKRDVNAPNIGWTLSTNGTSLQAYSAVDSGAGIATATGSVFTAGSLVLLGFVIDRVANTITAFTNGVASASSSLVTGAVGDISNTLPVRIGRIANSTGTQDFEMYSVGIWNRTLSTAEIVELYNYYNTVPAVSTLGANTGWSLIDTTISGAPWYVAGNTASTEGYGFYIEEWTGLDGAHHSRSVTPYGPGRGGATFGRQTSAHRTMALNVLLVGSSNRGLNHLFRWLESTLLNACSCENPSLWLREYCPPVTSLTDGLARADDVALIGPVQWESPPLEDAGCFIRRASFVLASGSPCLFREPTTISTTSSTYASWITVSDVLIAGDVSTRKSLVPLTTWSATNCSASAVLPPPVYGTTGAYITIKSPLEVTATGIPKILPNLRVVGLLNPMGASSTSFGEMFLKGALVLKSIEAGMEVVVDMAAAKIWLRRPHQDLTWVDGSRLLSLTQPRFTGSSSTWTRWFSFDSCDEPVIIVEPDEYYDSILPPTNYVSGWTVTIGAQERFGCV